MLRSSPLILPALLLLSPAFAADDSPARRGWNTDEKLELRLATNDGDLKWYLHVGFINAYPHMESENLVRELFNPAMRFLAPGFEDVNTVTDLREENMLLQPQIGLGRILSPRWTWTFQTGWAAGKVRTVANDTSLLLLPLHTDFEIHRGAVFLGTGFDFYPFLMPPQRPYKGLGDRLKSIRPYLGASVTATHATYQARVRVGLEPFANIGVKLSDGWLVFNINLHAGLEVPLTAKDSLVINYGINHFNDQEHDFEGTALSVEWKHMFRWRRAKQH